MFRKQLHHPFFIYIFLFVLLLFSVYFSLRSGGPVSIITGDPADNEIILWDLRFPKLIASLLIGASLSVSGYVFQNVLRNPLADPYILGISTGSVLGLALYISFVPSMTVLGAELASFSGALFALFVFILLFVILPGNSLVVILIGIGLSFFFSSIVTFLLSYMEGNKLVYINSWLVGNISQPESTELWILFTVLCFATVVFYIFSNSLDLLQFGDEFARSSGVNAKHYSLFFIILASLLTAASVSVCGSMGFVGLLVPHISRLIVKQRTSRILPVIILFGASFMALCSGIAGFLSINFAVPVGAVTSIIGAPVLIWLLYRRYRSL